METIYMDENVGPVAFLDNNESHRSIKCQPRDIEILNDLCPKTKKRIAWDICADIRLTQGYSEIGLMKGAIA